MYPLNTEVIYQSQRCRVWGKTLLCCSSKGLTEVACYDLMPIGKRSMRDMIQLVLPHHVELVAQEDTYSAEILPLCR